VSGVPAGVSGPLFAVGDLVEVIPAFNAAPGTYEVIGQDGPKWRIKGPLEGSHHAELLAYPEELEVVF